MLFQQNLSSIHHKKRFLEARVGSGLRGEDFFDGMKLLSENPLGREITWDYLRANFDKLLDTYTEYDPRLGQLLIDITKSFENEFLFYELLEFVFTTPTGASGNARFKALEIVSVNTKWLEDKEEEIVSAFGDPRQGPKIVASPTKTSFMSEARVRFDKLFADKKENILKFKRI